MGSLVVVAFNPFIQIGLQLGDGVVDLLAEGDPVERVQHGLVEPLDDAVGLRALGLGAGMIHVLDREVELVFVMFGIAAIFGAPIRQHAQELHLAGIKERDHAVIEQIGRGDRRLAVIELGEGNLRVGIDEGLLGDCQDFRVWAGIMGKKESHYVPTQRTCDPV